MEQQTTNAVLNLQPTKNITNLQTTDHQTELQTTELPTNLQSTDRLANPQSIEYLTNIKSAEVFSEMQITESLTTSSISAISIDVLRTSSLTEPTESLTTNQSVETESYLRPQSIESSRNVDASSVTLESNTLSPTDTILQDMSLVPLDYTTLHHTESAMFSDSVKLTATPGLAISLMSVDSSRPHHSESAVTEISHLFEHYLSLLTESSHSITANTLSKEFINVEVMSTNSLSTNVMPMHSTMLAESVVQMILPDSITANIMPSTFNALSVTPANSMSTKMTPPYSLSVFTSIDRTTKASIADEDDDTTLVPDSPWSSWNRLTTEMCRCQCKQTDPDAASAMSDLISDIMSQLSVNKAKLSATRRRKTSAHDGRVSSTTVGGTGVVIMVAFVVVLCVQDVRHLVFLVENVRKIIKGQ